MTIPSAKSTSSYSGRQRGAAMHTGVGVVVADVVGVDVVVGVVDADVVSVMVLVVVVVGVVVLLVV